MTKKRFIFVILTLIIIGLILVISLPRLLLNEATRKPPEIEKFVTRVGPAFSLENKIVKATKVKEEDFNPVPTDHSALNSPINKQKITIKSSPSNPPPIEIEEIFEAPESPPLEKLSAENIEPLPEKSTKTEKIIPDQKSGNDFKIQVSQQEIASMVFNGIYRNSAQEYRPALKGVSVKLNHGRGKVTIALNPSHLPQELLNQLPGVTRQTPTIYLGGEVGINLVNNTLSPTIYNVSLGRIRMPLSFIKSMVKTGIDQHVQYLLKLKSNQSTRFKSVHVQGGLLTIKGMVYSP